MKKVTIYDIAEEANVSVMTVTRAFQKNSVIKPETRSRILEIAQKNGYHPNSLASRLAQDRLLISVIIENTFTRLTEDLTNGMEVAGTMLKDQKVDLDLHVISRQDASAKAMIEEIETAIEKRTRGLIFVMEHYPEQIVEKINEIVDSGLSVITLINNPPSVKRLFAIQENEFMIGQVAAELLMQFIHKGEVAIFIGNESADVHKEILKGFRTTLEGSEVDLYKIYDTKEDMELSRQMIRQLLTEKPDIKGFFISTAKSMAVLREVKAMNMSGKLKIIASDLFPEIVEYINNGTAQATIFKNPRQQMIDAVTKLYMNVSGISDNTEDIYVIPQIIIRSNLNAYLRSKKA